MGIYNDFDLDIKKTQVSNDPNPSARATWFICPSYECASDFNSCGITCGSGC